MKTQIAKGLIALVGLSASSLVVHPAFGAPVAYLDQPHVALEQAATSRPLPSTPLAFVKAATPKARLQAEAQLQAEERLQTTTSR